MTVVRAVARPLLSSLFIVQGYKSFRHPEPYVEKTRPVTDRMVPMVKKVAPAQIGDRIPDSTIKLIRLNGAAQMLGGIALATGTGRRLGAAVMAASLVPTTLAGHSFWEESDPTTRAHHKVQFLKNLSLLGGMLLAAVDTEGKPGMAWRTKYGAKVAKRETRRAGKLARRQTKQLARTARHDARMAARFAKAELPFG